MSSDCELALAAITDNIQWRRIAQLIVSGNIFSCRSSCTAISTFGSVHFSSCLLFLLQLADCFSCSCCLQLLASAAAATNFCYCFLFHIWKKKGFTNWVRTPVYNAKEESTIHCSTAHYTNSFHFLGTCRHLCICYYFSIAQLVSHKGWYDCCCCWGGPQLSKFKDGARWYFCWWSWVTSEKFQLWRPRIE